MTKKTIKKRIISAVMSLVMLVSAVCCFETVSFAEDSEITDLKDKISSYEEKISAAQEQIDSLKGDKTQVQTYIEELDAQVALYQSQIDAYNDQIAQYETQIATYNTEKSQYQVEIDGLNAQIDTYNANIDTLNLQIETKYDELKDIIRSNYINGESSAVEVLLCSNDFSEYLTKVQFVSSLADYEQGIVDSINTSIAEIDATIAKIDEEKSSITALQAQIDEKIAAIATLEADVEADKANVTTNQDAIQEKVNENANYLQSLNDQSAEYQAMIDSYEAAIEEFDSEIQSIIRAQASSGSGTLVNSSGLICPLQYSGTYVSSGFYRNSDGSYHGALDLCVSGGTYGLSISAAESGTVVTASYHWSYGNYVLVDHGNGLSTLYAHCSSLAVSAGQSVSKGQTIAYVGSTGNSTGPHLHFEVRVNGSRVDPSGYISV